MGPATRAHFTVDVGSGTLGPNQFVMVAGSVEELGRWDPRSALALAQDTDRPSRWNGSVLIFGSQGFKFRYFIAYHLCGEKGVRLIIEQWESFLHPRNVIITAEQRNGECRMNQVDLFGYYAGNRLLSEGWLQYEEENQILLSIHGNSLKFYKSSRERKNCRIRITPLDVRHKSSVVFDCRLQTSWSQQSTTVDEEDEEDDSQTAPLHRTHSDATVAVLSDSNPRFRRQPDNGTLFTNLKDYVIFKTHSVAVEFLAFFLEVIGDDGKRVGTCFALPSSLTDTSGSSQLPFMSASGRPIGQIQLEYLFIRNIRRPIPLQSMEKSFSRHWKKRNTLEVGHRGAGNSFSKFAVAKENTIASLNRAAQFGADYVEFDVQLTKDKVAVIYHDFHCLVSVARRKDNVDPAPSDFHTIAVKDLKLDQIRLLMLDHVSAQKEESIRPLTKSDEAADHRPFPTLKEALQNVDPDVGFNVEVKYPMMQANGEHECEHYFERNAFVDIILTDILNYAGNRRVLLSSFDPDICVLISMKQNKYPVLFLCVGDTQRYTPFTDQRTGTSLTAVNFAASAAILGVNFNSEDLLKDPMPVKRASEFGLITFVWGDDLDKRDTINYFKRELGVDGLIYDRIGEEEGRRNVFTVEREQKRGIFLSGSGLSTPRVQSPSDAVSSTTRENGSRTERINGGRRVEESSGDDSIEEVAQGVQDIKGMSNGNATIPAVVTQS